MTARILLAALASVTLLIGLGGIWHELVMPDYYARVGAQIYRPEIAAHWNFLGDLLRSFALVALWVRFARHGESWIRGGLAFGGLIGVAHCCSLVLNNFGFMRIDEPAWILVEVGYMMPQHVAVGLAIARIAGTRPVVAHSSG